MNPSGMQINNKNMEYVAAVAQYDSITAAAESLYISQPALSRFISNLEKRIGVTLFQRVGNRFLLTYEGERFLYHAKRIMEIEQELQNELSDINKQKQGRLRLALPVLRSPNILPRIRPPFSRQYPNVDIIITELHSGFLENMLLDGDVDFAILNDIPKDPRIVAEHIRDDEVMLIVSPSHPLAGAGVDRPGSRHKQIDLSLFKEENFIMQPNDQRTRRAADRIMKDAGITPRVLCTTRSIEASVRMVLQDMGVCFAAETHIKYMMLPFKPICFSLGNPAAILQLSLCYLRGNYQPQYFSDFIETVKKRM